MCCSASAATWRRRRRSSAKTVTGITPDRVTTDGHDSYPRAIRTELGKAVRHRTGRYLNNRLEQDHRGLRGRYRPMRGFKCPRSAARFCRGHGELRNYLRPRSLRNQNVPALHRRLSFLSRSVTVLAILEAASSTPPHARVHRPYLLARVLTQPAIRLEHGVDRQRHAVREQRLPRQSAEAGERVPERLGLPRQPGLPVLVPLREQAGRHRVVEPRRLRVEAG